MGNIRKDMTSQEELLCSIIRSAGLTVAYEIKDNKDVMRFADYYCEYGYTITINKETKKFSITMSNSKLQYHLKFVYDELLKRGYKYTAGTKFNVQ